MNIRHKLFPVATIAIALCCLAPAHAQTNQGVIAGNVVDSTGAAIPNVKITAKNEATGSSYETVSTGNGNYRFPSIALGRYTLSAGATGYKSVTNTGVQVSVGTTTALDISLPVGEISETVTVESNAPTVETQSSDVGGTVTAQQIVDLPLALGGVGAMRSPEAFVFLIPGTAGPGTANSNNGIFISKLGGGQNFGAEILLDGSSTIRSENGSSFDEESPSVEAFSEFKVTTSTPAAEFGRTTGGIENFVTKSGTNRYHGTVFDIFRNDVLDANSYFNNGQRAYWTSVGNIAQANTFIRGSDKQNDYGGSLGGPVYIPHIYNGHDKTFFFFAWEQFRQSKGGSTTSNVPTAPELNGNFTDRLIVQANGQYQGTGQTNPCDGTPILVGQIFDPLTTRTVNGVQCRTAFANNTIPTSRFSPTAVKLLALYPKATNTSLGGNYTLTSSSPINNTTYTVRIDHSFGSKDKIFGSYSSRENTRHSPPNQAFPGIADYITQTQDFITHFGRGGWDHVFSPNILNHLNIGFNRSNSINGSIQSQGGINYAAQYGIANIPTGLPLFNIGPYSPLSRNQNDDEIDNGLRFNDSLSIVRGRNSFKVGFDWRYQQFSPLANGVTNGYFNFTANQTKASSDNAISTSTGIGAASFLLGSFDSGGVTIPSHQPRWLSNYWAGFFQDDFKVSNSLVLNLGVRYDVDQPRKEAGNNTSNFSPTAIDPKSGTPGALIFGTTCTNCNTRWADTWFKDFAPRIGFAYSPASWNNRLAVRGGFSVLYGPLQYSDFGGGTLTGYTLPITQSSANFDPGYKIDNGLNPYKVGVNLDPAFYDSGDSSKPAFLSNYIKPSYGRPAMINQWNLQVQQELAKDLIATIGYIGSSGAHLKSQEENINNISTSAFGLGNILAQPYSQAAPASKVALPYATFNTAALYYQALRPFPQYDFIATDCCLQNVGHSSYHALVASVERRLRQGLSLKASYTWSKSITNADSIINVTNGVSQEQNATDGKQQKFISLQDIPHTLVTSFTYQLPFGKNQPFLNFQNSFLRSLVSGFEIGGVLRYQSGQPMSFGCADGIPGYQNCIAFSRIPGTKLISKARATHIDPFRQLRLGNAYVGPDPNIDSEFNGLAIPTDRNGKSTNSTYAALQTAPALINQNAPDWRRLRAVKDDGGGPAFGKPYCGSCDDGAFQFGTLPRVTSEVRNYLYTNEDLVFLKKTPIGDNLVFFFKIELLNAFNRHVFSNPDNNPNDSYFGVPTGTINTPRNMQLTARIQF